MNNVPVAAWLIALIAMGAMGWASSYVFKNRGLSGGLGFWLGFFLGPIPMIVVVVFSIGSKQ